MICKVRLVAAVAMVGLTTACGALPHTAAMRTEVVSSLVFEHGPDDATVLIDGREAGRLAGKQTTIAIADGTHDVAVSAAGTIVFHKTIFIEDGTRKIISL